MSIPLHVMAALNLPYNHGNFCNAQLSDIRGMLETIRLGVEDFFAKFPEDKVNSRYLSKLARPFYTLENQADDWEEAMANMTEPEARASLKKLRVEVFDLATKMGPAAEAYRAASEPAWNQSKKLVPWRRVSDNRIKKLKKLLKKAREEIRYLSYQGEMFLLLLDQSNLDLADLAVAKEVAQAYKERAQNAIQQRDRAEARARLAEYQAEMDTSHYEDQLSVANNSNARMEQESLQFQQQLAALSMDNLQLQFQLLKL